MTETTTIRLPSHSARSASIVVRKSGADDDDPIVEELQRAFEMDDLHEDIVLGGYPEEFTALSIVCQQHARQRDANGHTDTAEKYRAIGMDIQRQLVRKGDWMPEE